MMHSWWLADLWSSPNAGPVLAISWIFWVIFSICLHELGHGFAAIWCGDTTPRDSGHITLNPFVHMGIPSLVMFAVVGIAWGLMPVNPSRFRKSWHDGLVSFAGPAVNIALAVFCIVFGAAWIVFAEKLANPTLYANTETFLRVGAGLNMVLFFLNLIPLPPLDGSRIIATFIPPYRRFLDNQKSPAIALVVLILLFQFVGPVIFRYGFHVAVLAIEILVAIFGIGSHP